MSPGTIDTKEAIGILLYGILSAYPSPERYLLAYAAKDKKHLVRGLSWAIIPIIISASLLLFMGLFMYMHNPGLDPDTVFIVVLDTFLSDSFLPVIFVLLIAGLMSSADTYMYIISSHIALLKKTATPISTIRKIVVLCMIVIAIIGYLFRDVVGLTVI